MTDQTQGAASGTEAPAGGGGDSLPSAADIMAFDPFGPATDLPEAKGPVEGTTQTPPPADDKGKQDPQAPGTQVIKADEKPPAGTAPPPGDQQVPQPPPVTTPPAQQQPDLAALIAQQTQTIKDALQAPKPAATGPSEPKPSKYQLGLPPQIINALRSENNEEFAAGMHAVINGMANRIWEDVQAHLTDYVQQHVPAMISSAHESQTTQQKVAQDFYGKYPSLANPMLKTLIQNVGLQIVQQRQAAGQSIAWDEQLRDQIAESIFTQLPQLRSATAPGATPPAGSPSPRKPPFSTGGGARPLPDPNVNEFTEMLSF